MDDALTLEEFFDKLERITDEVRDEMERCKKYTEERRRNKEKEYKMEVAN